MERKATPACKQRRKQLRPKRKGYADADEEREGVTYEPGMFCVIIKAREFILNSIVNSRLYIYIDVTKTCFSF